MNATPKCRCGLARDDDGRCRHCDLPGPIPCQPHCPRCAERDLYCEICRTRCGTKTAALDHTNRCRQREIDQARRTA